MTIHRSIFFKLHLFFFLALVVLILLFATALKEQKHQQYKLLAQRSMELSRVVKESEHLGCLVLNRQLKESGFKPLAIKPKNCEKLNLPKPLEYKLINKKVIVNIYEDKKGFMYELNRGHCKSLYLDTYENKDIFYIWVMFFMLLGGLASLYILILRNLLPLKHLYAQIIEFDKTKEFHYIKNSGKDEIALISNAINDGISRELRLKTARELFMRNIMHELKTPITRGKLIVELAPHSDNKQKLEKLFKDLENLVIQMAEIEKMHAFSLEKHPCNIKTMIYKAIELLGIDKVSIIACDELFIQADENLFTAALKNLIDNAYRHASSYPIIIECKQNSICVKNSGEPLTRPIEESLQAFVTDRGKSGLGLGLYIAQTVCELHDFKLNYHYTNEIHHFCIDYLKEPI